jgi:flagellar motility protein MotE (MotC chaperone)
MARYCQQRDLLRALKDVAVSERTMRKLDNRQDHYASAFAYGRNGPHPDRGPGHVH